MHQLPSFATISSEQQEWDELSWPVMTKGSSSPPPDPAIKAVAALDDPLRRGMFLFIRMSREPVTREAAAASVGISRKLAAFHLDKLVKAGVLRAHYHPAGRVRRVGRAPKVYEVTDIDINIHIPPRQHELLADVLLDAVLSEGEDEDARQAAARVAGQRGNNLGTQERRDRHLSPLGAQRALSAVEGIVARLGFEPARESSTCLRLRNCPFHPLAGKAPDLVCGMNHAFLTGLLAGFGTSSVRAVLAPEPGECCVQLTSSTAVDGPPV
jgi:predicted ArsR family transcriptional regulator